MLRKVGLLDNFFENKYNLIPLFILLTPFIDIINGLASILNFPSPGQVARPIIMLIFLGLLYKLDKTRFKDSLYLIITLMVTSFISLFSLHKIEFSQIVWDIKIIFTLTLVLSFSWMFSNKESLKQAKLLSSVEYAVFIISACIILTKFFGLGFSTYLHSVGSKGLFLGQNDIAAVYVMSFPILFYSIVNNTKRLFPLINFTLLILGVLILGTKSAILLIGLTFIVLVTLYIREKKFDLKRLLMKKTVYVPLLSILIVFICVVSFMWGSLRQWVGYQAYFFNHSNSLVTYILSGRNKSIAPMFETFWSHPIYLLVGATVSNGDMLLSKVNGFKTFMEFDPLALLYYNGALVLSFVVYLLIKYIFKPLSLINGYRFVNKTMVISLFLGFFYSTFGGHVIDSGIAGTYLAVVCGLVIQQRQSSFNYEFKNGQVTKN